MSAPDIRVLHGDCIELMAAMPDNSIDAIVTDPPYGLGFMGKAWDDLPPGLPWAIECLRVLKPGGHLLAFGGTRTWHRLACAVEDAGFEVRDSIAWLYATGFPKSLNASKALADKGICRCAVGELEDGDDQLRGVREGVSDLPPHTQAREVADLLAPMQRASSRSLVGDLRAPRTGGAEDAASSALRGGQPSMEGRGDAQAAEGQLRGRQVRPLPAGVPGDGSSGRLHHGAPSGDGSVDGALSAAVGSGEPQGPQPGEQRPVESGAVPVERGSQAWGGWPVCGRCSQPVIPDGLGTALKPAHEPIVVARKPLIGTVAANVLTYGTGALNIDATRIEHASHADRRRNDVAEPGMRESRSGFGGGLRVSTNPAGRWPANVVLDESQADALDQQSGTLVSKGGAGPVRRNTALGLMNDDGWQPRQHEGVGFGDSGGASRFFYCAKAPTKERPKVDGTAHPTVKPLSLMRWLVRLVTPPGGTILDPFGGSGTTGEAALLEGFNAILIEREADYLPLIEARLSKHHTPAELPDPEPDLFDLIEGEAS